MKWFKHMSNMRHDPKVKRLKKKYGSDGYSMYVEIITAIADNLDPINNILPFLEEDVFEISEEFSIAEHKATEIVNFCVDQGLLERSTNNYIFCFKLYKFVDEYFTKKQANTMHVADRNKEVISSYKDGGLPAALKALQKYIPDLMAVIGQIEVKQTNNRANLALLSPNSGVAPYQLSPDKKREEYIREDNIKLDEIKKEERKAETDFKPPPPYEPPKAEPDFEDDHSQDSAKYNIDELISVWNSCKNLTPFRGTSFHLGESASAIHKSISLSLFSQDEIIKSISNFNDLCLLTTEHVPSTFESFMTKSFTRWTDDAKPHDRIKKQNSSKNNNSNIDGSDKYFADGTKRNW